ncbi:UNVERIFIED_ORG: hypothetical protein E4P37_19710 [Bacillus sp. AZ43]
MRAAEQGSAARPVILVNLDSLDPGFHSYVTGPGAGRRRDVILLRDELDGVVVDVNDVRDDRLARLAGRLAGGYVGLAVAAFRRRRGASVYVTMTENEAIVLGALLKVSRLRIPVVAVGHYPAQASKWAAWRVARVHTHIDRILVLGSAQGDRLVDHFGVPRDKVEFLPLGIDTHYWSADRATPRRLDRPYVVAAGLQHRDHRTVANAVQGLGVDLLVAAASPWSTTGNEFEQADPPPGVLVEQPDLDALRDAYAGAIAVVTSTVETDFPAGTTTVLEGMALGKPAVVSRTVGGGNYVADRRRVLRRGPLRSTSAAVAARGPSAGSQGQTGFYFAPGDVEGLRDVLGWIRDHPMEAATVGVQGRRVVEEVHSLEAFVARIGDVVREVTARPQP